MSSLVRSILTFPTLSSPQPPTTTTMPSDHPTSLAPSSLPPTVISPQQSQSHSRSISLPLGYRRPSITPFENPFSSSLNSNVNNGNGNKSRSTTVITPITAGGHVQPPPSLPPLDSISPPRTTTPNISSETTTKVFQPRTSSNRDLDGEGDDNWLRDDSMTSPTAEQDRIGSQSLISTLSNISNHNAIQNVKSPEIEENETSNKNTTRSSQVDDDPGVLSSSFSRSNRLSETTHLSGGASRASDGSGISFLSNLSGISGISDNSTAPTSSSILSTSRNEREDKIKRVVGGEDKLDPRDGLPGRKEEHSDSVLDNDNGGEIAGGGGKGSKPLPEPISIPLRPSIPVPPPPASIPSLGNSLSSNQAPSSGGGEKKSKYSSVGPLGLGLSLWTSGKFFGGGRNDGTTTSEDDEVRYRYDDDHPSSAITNHSSKSKSKSKPRSRTSSDAFRLSQSSANPTGSGLGSIPLGPSTSSSSIPGGSSLPSKRKVKKTQLRLLKEMLVDALEVIDDVLEESGMPEFGLEAEWHPVDLWEMGVSSESESDGLTGGDGSGRGRSMAKEEARKLGEARKVALGALGQIKALIQPAMTALLDASLPSLIQSSYLLTSRLGLVDLFGGKEEMMKGLAVEEIVNRWDRREKLEREKNKHYNSLDAEIPKGVRPRELARCLRILTTINWWTELQPNVFAPTRWALLNSPTIPPSPATTSLQSSKRPSLRTAASSAKFAPTRDARSNESPDAPPLNTTSSPLTTSTSEKLEEMPRSGVGFGSPTPKATTPLDTPKTPSTSFPTLPPPPIQNPYASFAFPLSESVLRAAPFFVESLMDRSMDSRHEEEEEGSEDESLFTSDADVSDLEHMDGRLESSNASPKGSQSPRGHKSPVDSKASLPLKLWEEAPMEGSAFSRWLNWDSGGEVFIPDEDAPPSQPGALYGEAPLGSEEAGFWIGVRNWWDWLATDGTGERAKEFGKAMDGIGRLSLPHIILDYPWQSLPSRTTFIDLTSSPGSPAPSILSALYRSHPDFKVIVRSRSAKELEKTQRWWGGLGKTVPGENNSNPSEEGEMERAIREERVRFDVWDGKEVVKEVGVEVDSQTNVQGGDQSRLTVYWIKFITENHPDRDAVRTLRMIRKACPVNSKVMIADCIVPTAHTSSSSNVFTEEGEIKEQLLSNEGDSSSRNPLAAPYPLPSQFGSASTAPYQLDMLMLTLTNSVERTPVDFEAIASLSGFKLGRIHYTRGYIGILELIPI